LGLGDEKYALVSPPLQIPKECLISMSDADMKFGQDLLKDEAICGMPGWKAELEMMLKRKKKAEIQALSNFGFQYLTQDYLPKKLEAGNWL